MLVAKRSERCCEETASCVCAGAESVTHARVGLVGTVVSLRYTLTVSSFTSSALGRNSRFFRLLQGGGSTSRDDLGPQFTDVFLITFIGSCVVTLNIRLLGGKM